MEVKPGYYSNPAFCQQSEFYSQQRPAGSVRRSPVGAQTNHVVFDTSLGEIQREEEEECVDNVEEQEFYEEVIVDDKGFIKGKKFVVVAQNQEGRKYIQSPQEETLKGSRYGHIQETQYSTANHIAVPKSRCEYIPMQEQDVKLKRSNSRRSPVRIQEERVEVAPGIIHRYAVIETEEETDLSDKNNRYALVPVNELNRAVQNDNRYEYIPGSSSPIKIQPNSNRYEYIQTSPSRNTAKYDYITQSTPQKPKDVHREYQNQSRPGTNPIATQKLYQLLSTPKKSRNNGTALTPQKVLSPRKVQSPPLSPIPKDPFHTPKSSPQKVVRLQPSSRAQQKLNYAIATKQMAQDKRSTAIVPPMCSSPIQSVYSETTYSQKSESWMNLSASRPAAGMGLSAAALILFLCGNVISGLSFYMISQLGKWYYLDFSLAAGFTCIIMGLLGFRSRNVDRLPNRNYLSGFLILCVFSILTCAGLSVLLIKNPEPGTPLADMTSGAVCGFSVLILLLATTGLVSSYCCKHPPPDNRVQHCSPGLTV